MIRKICKYFSPNEEGICICLNSKKLCNIYSFILREFGLYSDEYENYFCPHTEFYENKQAENDQIKIDRKKRKEYRKHWIKHYENIEEERKKNE